MLGTPGTSKSKKGMLLSCRVLEALEVALLLRALRDTQPINSLQSLDIGLIGFRVWFIGLIGFKVSGTKKGFIGFRTKGPL